MKNLRSVVGTFVVATLFGAAPAFAQADSGTEAAGGAAAPNDAQIAQIVVTANQVDIDAAKLAKTKTKNKEVKEFADTMIRDHGQVNKDAKALVTKLKVTPQPSATSKSLAEGGKKSLADLKKLKGAEFDKAYVDNEVTYHQQVIDAIKTTLIPNAKNEQLKALLEKYAPVFEAHLEHAKMLQEKLQGGGK